MDEITGYKCNWVYGDVVGKAEKNLAIKRYDGSEKNRNFENGNQTLKT